MKAPSASSPAFDAKLFLGERFDCEKFVTDLRKSGVTLEDLSSQLQAFVEQLNTTLVSMIEKDYSAFLKLSAMLVNIDDMVAVLREPIDHLSERVGNLDDIIQEPLQKHKALQIELKKTQLKRQLLELNLSAWDSLRKVELEVERISEAEKDESGRSMDLERATQRLAMVSFLTKQSQHQDMPLLRQIKARTRGLQQALTEQLEVAFGVELVPANFTDSSPIGDINKDALCRVLRSYVAIDSADLAHDVFRKLIARPFLERCFTVGKLDGGVRGSCNGLADMYEEVIKFLVRVCQPLLEILADPDEGLSTQFDFVGNGIGLAVSEVLTDKLSRIYTSGVADTLHFSYNATNTFYQLLEKISSKPETTARIREETLKKWNLSVYNELRRQELMGRLREALDSEALVMNESSDDAFSLQVSSVMWKEVARCRDKDTTFLQVVAFDMFKLMVELLHEYTSWSEASAVEDTENACWRNVACKQRIHLAKDCQLLIKELDTQPNLIGTSMFEGKDAVEDTIAEALGMIQERLKSAAQGIHDVIRISLSKECTASLSENLKGTVGLYRLSNHAPPSKPSAFVGSLLEPFESFWEENKSEAKAMGDEVLRYVCKEYMQQASKIAEEVRNTEAALLRFRRSGKNQTSTLSSTSKSLNKQFGLDVEELGRCAERLEIDTNEVIEFRELVETFGGD